VIGEALGADPQPSCSAGSGPGQVLGDVAGVVGVLQGHIPLPSDFIDVSRARGAHRPSGFLITTSRALESGDRAARDHFLPLSEH
jgi:hypothetical protein